MNDVGHLYVLANSAMPGLVKVGKTTRSPAERATELSTATGLPTPFIVVYEQLFDDCSAAESFVHTYLANRGFRVSNNREFFSAPVNDVVRAIALAPGCIDVDCSNETDQTSEDDSDEVVHEEKPSLRTYSSHWRSLYEEAGHAHVGTEDVLQNYKKALRLYLQAAKLGALPAYSEIGIMHLNGLGIQKDTEKAIDYLSEGASKGNIHCYWEMGMIFLRDKEISHLKNAEKCFTKFIKAFNGETDELHLTLDQWHTIVIESYSLRIYQTLGLKNYPIVIDDFFCEYGHVIAELYGDELLNRYKGPGNKEILKHLRNARDYFASFPSNG